MCDTTDNKITGDFYMFHGVGESPELNYSTYSNTYTVLGFFLCSSIYIRQVTRNKEVERWELTQQDTQKKQILERN